MSVQIRRVLLGLIAVTVIAVALGRFWTPPDEQRLSAQDSSLQPTPTWTPSPTATLLPGQVPPTPTPTRSRRVANEITHPASGDAVSGRVIIRGTALIRSYRRYDLHIAPTGSDNWQWLTTNYEVVRDGILYVLDSTDYTDGYYDLRLRAIDDQGTYTEAFARAIEVRNANPPTPTPFIDAAGNPVTVIEPPTPTFTPTATPTSESRVEGGQGFYGLKSGAVVRGFVPILGTVNGWWQNPFVRYEIYLSRTGAEDWTWVYSNDTQIWQDQIYMFDTTRLPNGFYDMRLRIVYADGNYDDYFLRALQVANGAAADGAPGQPVGITAPEAGSRVGGVVDFRGTAVDPDFLRWELYWSPAGEDAWAFLVSSEKQVAADSLAQLDLSYLKPGAYDFLLRIVRNDTNYTDTYVRNLQVEPPTPTPMPTEMPTPTPGA